MTIDKRLNDKLAPMKVALSELSISLAHDQIFKASNECTHHSMHQRSHGSVDTV